MALTPDDIEALCREIDETCRDGNVQKIWDGAPGEVVLKVRLPGKTLLVLVASGNHYARIHLIDARGERMSPTHHCTQTCLADRSLLLVMIPMLP